jgi:hypothetical protein
MSLETLMDSSQEIFQLNKDIISFKINKKDLKANDEPISISEDEIKVTNITNDYIAFLIKTNKKKTYAVDPSHCIIGPKEIKTLIFTLYNIKGEELDPKKHKFRFEGFIIPENEKNIEAKDLFNSYISDGKKIIGNLKKLNVKYIYEEEKEDQNIKYDESQNIQNIKNMKKEEKTKSIQNISEQNKEQNIIDNDNTYNKLKDNEGKEETKKQQKVKNNYYKIIGFFIVFLFIFFCILKFYLM